MSDVATVMYKLGKAADILKAAQLLHKEGLITEDPTTYVKRYVQANPDINRHLAKMKHPQS